MVDFFQYAASRGLRVTTRDSSGRVVKVESGRSALNREKRRQQKLKQEEEDFQKKRTVTLALQKGAINTLKTQAKEKGLDPNKVTLKRFKSNGMVRQIPVISSRRVFESKTGKITSQKGFYAINPISRRLEWNTQTSETINPKFVLKKLKKRVESETFGDILERRSTPTKESKSIKKPSRLEKAASKLLSGALRDEAIGISETNKFKKFKLGFSSVSKIAASRTLNFADGVIKFAKASNKALDLAPDKLKQFVNFAKTTEGQKIIKDKGKEFGLKAFELSKKDLSDPAIQAIILTATTKAISEWKRKPITTTFGVITDLLLFELALRTISTPAKLVKKYGAKTGGALAKELKYLKQTRPNIFLTEAQKKLPKAQRLKMIKLKQRQIITARTKFKSFIREEKRLNAVKKAIEFDKKLEALPKTVVNRVISKVNKIKSIRPIDIKKDILKIIKTETNKIKKKVAKGRLRIENRLITTTKRIKLIPKALKSKIKSNVKKFAVPVKKRYNSFKDYFKTIKVKPSDVNLKISESQLKSLARLREQQSKTRLLLEKADNLNEFIKIPFDKTFKVNNIRAFINFLKRNPKNWKYVLVQETKDFARVVIDGKNILIKLTAKKKSLLKQARKTVKSGADSKLLRKGKKPKQQVLTIDGQRVEIIRKGADITSTRLKKNVLEILNKAKTTAARKKLSKKTFTYAKGKGQIQILKIEPVKVTKAKVKLKQLQAAKAQVKTVQKQILKTALIKKTAQKSIQKVLPLALLQQERQIKQSFAKNQTKALQSRLIQNQQQILNNMLKKSVNSAFSNVILNKSAQIIDTVQKTGLTRQQAQAVENTVRQILKTINKTIKTVPKRLIFPLEKNWDKKLPNGFERIVNVIIRIKGKNKEFKLKLTPNRAIKKVASLVDNTTNRSFQLKIIGIKKIKDIGKQNLSKFRLKKSKGSPILRIVEKTKYAIDTKGEKQGLKISKLLKKNVKKVTKRRKSTTRKNKAVRAKKKKK